MEHENSTHRRRWRCYEHPETVYLSPDGLKQHLHQSHYQSHLADAQVETLVDLSAISVPDDRPSCPVCSQDGPFPKGLENHLASHLERIAMFALPRAVEEAGSAQAKSGGRSSGDSREFLVAPVFSDPGYPNSAASEEPRPDIRSRIVTLKLKKAGAKRAKELLSLPPKDALRKERSISEESTPPPARKRPRLLYDGPPDGRVTSDVESVQWDTGQLDGSLEDDEFL